MEQHNLWSNNGSHTAMQSQGNYYQGGWSAWNHLRTSRVNHTEVGQLMVHCHHHPPTAQPLSPPSIHRTHHITILQQHNRCHHHPSTGHTTSPSSNSTTAVTIILPQDTPHHHPPTAQPLTPSSLHRTGEKLSTINL